MRNKNGNREHACLVPDLPGNAFIFSPLSMMLSIGLLYMAFVMLMYIPSMLTFWRVFTIKGCWIVSKTIFPSIEMIMWFLFFNFLMGSITLTDIQILKNPCIPGMNPTGSWWMIFLVYCWIQIASVVLRIFYLCSSVILACTFLFLVISLSGFGVRVLMTSQDEFGSFPFSAVCWNNFRRIGVNSSLNVW